MAKRILNRKDLRADYDAAERRRADEEERDETEEEETEEEGEEKEAEEAAEEEEEEAPVVKKRKPAKPKTTKSRSRSAKVTRMRVLWGVFDNSNRCVSTFEYPRRKEAEELAAKLTTEKKSTHFLQPVKEPIEEK